MTDPTASEQSELDGMTIDFKSFDYGERMELQQHFDCDYPDLVSYVLAKYGSLDVSTDVKLRDGTGKVRFAEEVLRQMVWIVRRRTNTAASVDDFDGLDWGAMRRTLMRPKASSPKTGRSRKI